MATLAGIEFDELPCTELDLGPVRKLRCKRADAISLINALLGLVKRTNSDIIECSRTSEHPVIPGFFTHEITKEITADDEHVTLTVTYSKPKFIPGFAHA